MMTDYRPMPQDLALTTPTPIKWSDTFCKAQIASGTIVPAFDPPRRYGFQLVLWMILALVPLGFVAGLVFGR